MIMYHMMVYVAEKGGLPMEIILKQASRWPPVAKQLSGQTTDGATSYRLSTLFPLHFASADKYPNIMVYSPLGEYMVNK
jgi:hypothetical protein